MLLPFPREKVSERMCLLLIRLKLLRHFDTLSHFTRSFFHALVDNLSALGSIFARRKILVGSKQDSARSDFDSDEWS